MPDDDQDGLSDIIEQEMIDANPSDALTNLVDVAGSGDYDGDGLTNLQEWESKTDPLRGDSDGDRVPDGEDPWPLTNRDTDGDGLPDDWETYHGLNPGSASGANGASGDPDGDGINNLAEFQLGGAPNDANSPGYRFHREKMGQLRVDIQNSTNCAGTQSSRQLVERRIQFVEMTQTALPPIEFTFKVSVTGRVERQNSGYDQVSVNDEWVLGGSSEGLGCEMANKSGSVLVKVQSPPGELILSYDTVDGLYHVGAFAEVTDIELVEAMTNLLSVDLEFQNFKMSNGKVIDPLDPPRDVRVGVIQGDTITFKAKLTPPDIPLNDSDYVWSGAKTGNGPTIDITFNNACNYAEGLSVLGCSTLVGSITAVEVPPPNEDAWAIIHPPSAIIAYQLSNEVVNWASANQGALGGGWTNGRTDAARHSYWNVLMSVEMDAATAEGAATAHERTNYEASNPEHNAIVMDLHNNGVGRSISSGLTTNRVDCQNAVINALNAGTLWIMDDLANANESGLLMPSNQ